MRALQLIVIAGFLFELFAKSSHAELNQVFPPPLLASQYTSILTAREKAVLIFKGLTGKTAHVNDSRIDLMEILIQTGIPKFQQMAAQIPTLDDDFINLTARNFFASLINYDDPNSELNDFIATGMGAVAEGIDELDHGLNMRKLLSEDLEYRVPSESLPRNVHEHSPSNNIHYRDLDLQGANVKRLVKGFPQSSASQVEPHEPAGLLTSRAWASLHLAAGTNRRWVFANLQQFTCMKVNSIRTIKDFNYVTHAPADFFERIRKDVSHDPGGNPMMYIGMCASCHINLDNQSTAAAHFEYSLGKIEYDSSRIQNKYYGGPDASPGYRVTDSTWQIPLSITHPEMGWQHDSDTFITGKGVTSYGEALARSDAFASCMVERAVKQVCGRREDYVTEQLVKEISQPYFSNRDFYFAEILKSIVLHPYCLVGE